MREQRPQVALDVCAGESRNASPIRSFNSSKRPIDHVWKISLPTHQFRATKAYRDRLEHCPQGRFPAENQVFEK